MKVGMPPRSWNQRLPAACDAPTAIAASSLVSPLAISRQNSRSASRRSDGFPGDFIGALPVSAFIHPAGLPINTSKIEVLRRPVESTFSAAVRVEDDAVDLAASGRDRDLQDGADQRGIVPLTHRVARGPAGEGVVDGGEVERALAGVDLRHVAPPQHVDQEAADDEAQPGARADHRRDDPQTMADPL